MCLLYAMLHATSTAVILIITCSRIIGRKVIQTTLYDIVDNVNVLIGFPGNFVAFNRLLCPCESTIKKPQQSNRTIPKQSNHIKSRAQFLLLNYVV